jgi:glycosyltransferase involved in cell wall biosynthesis
MKSFNVEDIVHHSPLVSIIIPSFNYGHYIPQTLSALLNQSYQNWEAIIVDDGSKDNTQKAVDGFITTDSRFKYFYKENGGLADARNYGITKAQGQYIQFLDADDLLSYHKLSIQTSFMEFNKDCHISYTIAKYFASENPDILYNNYNLCDEEWMQKASGNGVSLLMLFINENLFPVNSALIRRDLFVIDGLTFNTEMKYLEDWEFWIRCVLKRFHFNYIPDEQAFSLIRVHKESMSKNRLQMYNYEEKLFKKLYIAIYNRDLAEKEILLGLLKNKFLKIQRKILSEKGILNFKAIKELISQIGYLKFFKIYIKELNQQRKNLLNGIIQKVESR